MPCPSQGHQHQGALIATVGTDVALKSPMTVAELIALLQKLPQDSVVLSTDDDLDHGKEIYQVTECNLVRREDEDGWPPEYTTSSAVFLWGGTEWQADDE